MRNDFITHRTWRTHASGARRSFLAGCILLVFACLNGETCTAAAQALTVRLSVVSFSPAVVRIEGHWQLASDTWSFRDNYGPLRGLGDRIANFAVTDAFGNKGTVRRSVPADFKSEKPVSSFSYDVRVSEPSSSRDAAHVSWLNEQGGYLMLADLLPTNITGPGPGVLLEFQLPAQWSIVSSVEANPLGRYEVPDPGSAVFFVGKDLRLRRKQLGRIDFLLATIGDWPFPSDSLIDIAARILRDHRRHVGVDLRKRAVLMLGSFPAKAGAEQWTAETRGSNIVLILGRDSPADVLLGRLSVVLTHELFHLWVPGALSFTGDYAWFYEGFTLYQALRSAVRLGFIDFQEYLSTMSRVYDSYLATVDRDRLSLFEASQKRWTMAPSLVYDKGMLLAFLCDLELRSASRNRRSLDDLYSDLFREQPLSAGRDGNQQLISLLNQALRTEQFTKRYISTPGAIRLETEVPTYGLMVESSSNRSRLQVRQNLRSEQRQLLGALGYRGQRN